MNALRGKEGERNIRQRPLLDAVINSVTKTASSETPEDAPENLEVKPQKHSIQAIQ